MKSISNCNTFFISQKNNPWYVLKISITHNKKRIPLLNLLINYITARSEPQILSILDEFTFLFLIFVVIGFVILQLIFCLKYSHLIPLPEADLSRKAKVFDCKGLTVQAK